MYDVEAAPKLERMGGRGPQFPAVIMSQFAARQYTKWLSKKTGRFYRLPSEAEWEYAARANTKTAYFFGDDPAKLGDYAWFNKNSNEPDGDTGYHPIMQKKPNPWGLYDIYGNVSEWCIDQYDAEWYKQFAGKTTPAEKTINWPTKLYPRVLRGGFYDSEAAECRSASRLPTNRLMNAIDPQIPKSPHWMSDGFFLGFRVVSPVKPPATDEERNKWWNADDPVTTEVIKRDRERKELVQKGDNNK
ncbi:MAG TPA: formylglycine-generating enzyme family protein, partial [Tepidisphaeraceae bacterium]|nr:formylglycine-generating enzyme family protein [Tepidisphaeraceae bacterium]